MKKIGEIRSFGIGGIPLKDFWGQPRSDIHVDIDMNKITSEISYQTEEFKRQIESLKDAQYAVTTEIEASLAAAVEEMKEIESSGWILQSQKMVEKAEELLRAGLIKDSIKLCESAISLNPGNMDAYVISTVAFGANNEIEKARECLKKSIYLLLTPDYKSESSNYRDVLGNIKDSGFEELIPNFQAVLRKNLKEIGHDWVLVDGLMELSLLDFAKEVAEYYATSCDDVLRQCIQNNTDIPGYVAEEYLFSKAYLAKISKKIGVDYPNICKIDPAMHYSQGLGDSLLNGFHSIQDRLIEAKDFIHNEVRQAFKRWESNIKSEINKKASEEFKTFGIGNYWKGWSWWVIFILSIPLFYLFVGWWGIIPSVFTPYFVGRIIKKNKVSNRIQNLFEKYKEFMGVSN